MYYEIKGCVKEIVQMYNEKRNKPFGLTDRAQKHYKCWYNALQ
jgi:hypothetical protein